MFPSPGRPAPPRFLLSLGVQATLSPFATPDTGGLLGVARKLL